jgi:hypothetical protein
MWRGEERGQNAQALTVPASRPASTGTGTGTGCGTAGGAWPGRAGAGDVISSHSVMDVLLCATSALAGASVRIRASGAAHCISRGLAVSAMTIGAGACVSGIDASANTLADPFSRASTPGEAAESATLVLANTSVEFEAMCANVRAVMRISYSLSHSPISQIYAIAPNPLSDMESAHICEESRTKNRRKRFTAET